MLTVHTQEFPFVESVRGTTMTHCLVSMATVSQPKTAH